VLVVPLLISATALSHSIQFNWRISETYAQTNDLKDSCYKTVKALFYPGLAGVITDATGILLIALIPIPLMEKLGISIFVWCLSMVFGILIFNPVINLYMPPMKNAARWREARRNGFMEKKFLPSVFKLCSNRKKSWVIVGCFLALALVTFQLNTNLIIGDIEEGSPILKPDSTYNQDVEFMAKRLPGSMNPMLVIVEGEEDAVKEPELLKIVDRFQAHMAKLPEVTMTISIVNLIKGINMAFYENNPNYFLLPDNRKAIYSNLHLLTSGGAEPGDYDIYYSHDFNNLSITIYCVNHLPSTIAKLLKHADEFISKNKLKIAEVKLAGGRIGVIAANNESIVVELATTLTAALVLTGLFVMIVFRSFVAGLILVVPLSLASWFTFGYMAIAGIAINLQSLPVSIIAIGIGVDYGVYLLSRMREEHRKLGDLGQAVQESIDTAGNAIVLTGIIVIAGVVFWVFSDIMFQAEMGILFSIVTLFHVLGALVLLPAMIQILRPRFLFK